VTARAALIALVVVLGGACKQRPPDDRAACAGGDGAACYRAGKLAVESHDDKTGMELLRRGCDAGDGKSCTMLADCHGLKREQLDEQVRLYQRACDLRDGAGCYPLARLYEQGRGVPADAARARTLYERGCALGDFMSCDAIQRAH
jgi:TPR repeat protein